MKSMIHDEITSMTLEEIEQLLKSLGEQSFRAKQIFQWLHQKHITSFDEMTNLSKSLRDKLKEKTSIASYKIVEKYISTIDKTTKYLFALSDHHIIESVLMQYTYGNTVCISSQVGCRMGCSFCASTIGGFVRNITAGEMLGQIYAIQKDCEERISNIVIMGSGEPLDNYDQIVQFIHLVNSPLGIQIGQRHITISTCGLVDKIYALAKENLQITLAISLHAPNDEIRKSMMPIAKKYSIEETLKACFHYVKTTTRRITFEYALIDGVNDQEKHARELANKLRKLLCHVNLIPINEVEEKNFKKSNKETIDRFAHILHQYGIETTIRRKLGSDIDAACGQLRRKYLEQDK